MFTELAPLAAKTTLLIIVVPESDGRLRLTITPKADEAKKSALAPFVVEGTPAELDEGLPAALKDYAAKNIGLADAMTAADAEIAALGKEKQAQVAAARRPTAKAEANKTAEPPPPPKPLAGATGTLDLKLEPDTGGAAGSAQTNT